MESKGGEREELNTRELKMKRIYVDMCADIFHLGHVSFLKQAKSLHEDGYLVVGLHSDETIQGYKRLPVCTLAERVVVVEACKYVDEVIQNAPIHVSREYIEENALDVVVHGSEISDADVQKMYGAAVELGIYQEVPRTPHISTSDLIDRIKSREDL